VSEGPLALGVLVSGGGTNLEAIFGAIEARELSAAVRVVISNKAGAYALERARARGVPTCVIDHRAFAGREAFDAEIVRVLRDHAVSCVVLAGFMRIVTSVLIDAFPDRVVNVHPALLPSFPGVHGPAQALAYGVKVAGCTVHFVDAGVDTGPIIAQRAVDVAEGDDAAALAARILVEEHRALPQALQAIAEGRVRVDRPAEGRPRVTVRSR
jgi:phosphoribosylglycinamide formyltransferase-1